MNSMSYAIRTHSDGRAHEVRLIVDGADWIGDDHLGLDPPDLVRELTQTGRGRIVVGCCTCGCIGCDDLVVDVTRTADTVRWSSPNRAGLTFDAAAFDDLIAQLAGDHGWEPLGRGVERQLNALFAGRVTDDGYAFEWSSTRIRPCVVVISVNGDDGQKLLEFSWDGETLDSALRRGRQRLRERFAE